MPTNTPQLSSVAERLPKQKLTLPDRPLNQPHYRIESLIEDGAAVTRYIMEAALLTHEHAARLHARVTTGPWTFTSEESKIEFRQGLADSFNQSLFRIAVSLDAPTAGHGAVWLPLPSGMDASIRACSGTEARADCEYDFRGTHSAELRLFASTIALLTIPPPRCRGMAWFARLASLAFHELAHAYQGGYWRSNAHRSGAIDGPEYWHSHREIHSFAFGHAALFCLRSANDAQISELTSDPDSMGYFYHVLLENPDYLLAYHQASHTRRLYRAFFFRFLAAMRRSEPMHALREYAATLKGD